MRTPLYTSLDAALDEIAPYGIELKNGNSNHAPMVAEALCALGRPEAIAPWLARYRERMQPRPAPVEAISGEEWRGALGRRERFSDWASFFAAELDKCSWQTALDRWAARLMPGFCAAATHGVIRLGHAARGIAQNETPSRRRELADALAGWAATWQRLPENDGAKPGALSPHVAITCVPVIPPDRRRPGNIVAALAALADFPEFAPVIDMVDMTGAVPSRLAEATEVFARVAIANIRDIPTAIAFIHAVTSHAALGNLLPHIGEATARIALRYAWQSGCAIYACYGSGTAMAEDVEAGDELGDALAERAVAHGDEHVIKFTEACLNRNAILPSAAYCAAIRRVAGVVRPRPPG